MAEHRVPFAVLLLLLVACAATLSMAKPLEFDEYGDGGSDEDEDVGDVVAPDLVSSPATVRVPMGRRMKLTCAADSELTHHQIIWKKLSADGGSNPKVLAVGNIKVDQDRRLRTRTVGGNKAVELTIDSVEEGDAGVYECSVSTQPPKSVDFTVTVGGEGTEQEVVSVRDAGAAGQAEGVGDGGGAAAVHVRVGLLLLALGVAAAHALRL